MDTEIEGMLRGGPFKRLMEEQSAELRQKYDLKKAELDILYFLSRSGQHNTSTDIHQQLMMNRGHISQAIDQLCRRNYLIAIPDEHDRRYIHYKIADSAQGLIAELTERREEINQQILKGISEEEWQVFLQIFEKIRTNIDELIDE